jgi:acetyltransferase-like isoleucine patch superfamily enzyme
MPQLSNNISELPTDSRTLKFASTGNKLNFRKVAQRFLIPQFVSSLYYLVKYKAMVSFKSEVELSPLLQLGKGVKIASFCKFKATEGPLSIGDKTGFANGCFVTSGENGISIGDNCIFGPNVSASSANYNYERLDVPYQDQGTVSRGIKIGNNVWIGSNVTIIDGTSIGDNTIVVANSMVNRRFPANCIIQGSPAKIVLKRT